MKKLKYFLIITILWISTATYAQLNPMGSLYFQNPYQANPALAGIEKGWEVNVASKIQWTAIEGAPTMQSATATFGTNGQKIGFGLNVYNENAGVFLSTAIKGTYAYHLPLNDENTFLDFGLSGGFTSEWIDYDKVIGDLTDPAINLFNQRKLYVDGDLGMAYRDERLTAQFAIPNLKRFLNRDINRTTIDRSLYMASVGYKLYGKNFTIEPTTMYRRIENYKDIIDLGAQFQCMEEKLAINAIYHSTNSITFGIGTFYQKQLTINCFYTTGTSDLGKYSNGEFEIALQYKFR
jgi:type IX secretion system PorP/SprF family membrane protein